MTATEMPGGTTTAVRPGFALDIPRLDTWMRVNVDGYRGPLSIEQFSGGQSNPTYKLVTPGCVYVLRRKPTGMLLKGAHAIEREAQVMQALAATDVPVARVYGLCLDDAVIGTAFYVMSMVEGRTFWDATLPQVAAAERPAYFDAMNVTIAALHKVDYVSAGLNEFGRAGSFFKRQIARWSRQYLDDADAGRDPNMDRLIEWLPNAVPSDDETSIVHGDFRCDNLIFHPTKPQVLAVLDWELSTLGHPGADFAYHTMMYRLPPHIVAGLGHVDPRTVGLPSELEYVRSYCRRVGKDSMPDYDFYIAFNLFRLAAIFHGIKGRVLRGTASSAQARDRVKVLPELTQLTWLHARQCGA